MSEGNTVYNYNLLRSDDILWAGEITGTAQRITLSHIWARKLISSEAFARIFKPGHTYTLSYTVKVIEPAPGTYRREDRYGVTLYSPSGIHGIKDTLVYHANPSAGDTFQMSGTFTAADDFPGDVIILAYSDLSRDSSNNLQPGIVEIDDLMIVEGPTPAAWAPAEGETLTADGGGGGMTEPTNLVKTQPDETATYTVKAVVNDDGGHTDAVHGNVLYIKLSANTSFHIGITIKPDKDIPSGRVWSWITYKDDAGATNFANSSAISYVIPAGVWTRLEWTVTVPAGMTSIVSCLSFFRLADETKFQATNFVVYPLTGGRIVRARGTTALVSVNDGAKGDQGIPGKDGKSPTVSVSKSGTVTTIVVTNADGSKTTQKVNDGVNGTPGKPGADGKTPYFHVKYSNDGGKTFTANSGETVGTYIGTCTDYNSADSTSVSSYTWARIKGDTGATGAQGPKGATGAQGPQGVKGDTGISVTLTVDEWYLSTSSGSLSGGSWSDKRQAWASGKYYWRRIKTTYSDGRTSYTPSNNGYYDAVITDAVAKANDAYSIADGKNAIYYSYTAPAGNDYAVNDIWFDTKNDNAMHYWDGSRWVQKQFGTTAVKDGAILADKLAVNSVTADKLAVGSVTANKLAVNSVTADKLAVGSVTANKLAVNSVTADKLAVGSVTANKLAVNSVTSDKVLTGAINADKIAANAVSLGNLDSTLVTSNILGASVSNLSTWYGTDKFISAATMTYSDDYMTSFSYTRVTNWEHAYYIVNGLNNNEQYTVSFEFDAPKQTTGYIPFCIFTEAGFSSRKTSFKSGDLATIQIPPTAGNHRYSVSFTAKSTVIMAFNFGQLANGVQMAFSVGKFKLESGSADTGWVIPRGLYLDNDELRINADSIRTGTLDSININGAVINGGTGNFTGDINATSIKAKQKYLIYDTFSNGTKTVELASMSGTYDAPTLLIGNGFGNVTVALNGSAGQSESVFNVGVNGTGTLMCNTAVATNFIGNWNGLSADFSTYSSGATWIPVFNNMKLQHTLPNDIANLAGCARVCSTVWAKTLDCGLKHGIVIISKYRVYLFWYSGPPSNMGISYKAIYGDDANTTFKDLNKTGTGNCWRITVTQNSSITVIGGY